jgi:hypothetical protein
MSTEKLLAERATTHGKYEEHAEVTQGILMAGTSWHKLTPCQRESLHMFAHKMGRIVTGNPNLNDHWDDIAGYAVLVSKDINRRKEEHLPPSAEVYRAGIGLGQQISPRQAEYRRDDMQRVPRFADGTPKEDSNKHG